MLGLVLDEVSRRFGPLTAVDKVSLDVEAGAFVTLLGASGCGKTTTLRMIAGLERNDDGRIAIGERIVSEAARGLFVPPEKRELGMVFQSYAIWPHMTVFDNVAFPLRVRGTPAAQIRARVRETLELVEMAAYADRPAPALSGGQQQRIAIARALVATPKVLLMDEPLSNLDAKLREQMRIELRALQRRLGITTVYVTHDQEEAMALSDHVVVMAGGRVLQEGAPREIYRRPASRAVAAFLGAPNLLPARVTDAAAVAGGYRVSLAGENWAGSALAATASAPGRDMIAVVRAEALRVAGGEAALAGEIEWRGRVRQTVYRGGRISALVEAAGTVLHAELGAEHDLAAGDMVALRCPADHVWAVPA